MISIKKFLDMERPWQAPPPPPPNEFLSAAIGCYRSVLLALGKSAAQGCSEIGVDLEKNLTDLAQRLSADPAPESLRQIQKQVEVLLHEWGGRTADHLKAKAAEVKELLIALASTAESVGERNHLYTSQFKDLTVHLETIGHLDDVTRIRSALVKRVTELKESVVRMTRDNQQLVTQLRAEVSSYEDRLKTVEHLILKDELTGVGNRRSAEERIQSNIANEMKFCVLMIDIDRFKLVNDKYGHLAGDDLLRQFAAALQRNTRSGDMVSRWGGDEFMVLLACDGAGAMKHIDRIQKRVLGTYTIPGEADENDLNILIDASIGLAEWHPRETMQQLVAQADAAMYRDKRVLRLQ